MDSNKSHQGPLTGAREREHLAAESGSNAQDRKGHRVVANSKDDAESNLRSPSACSDCEWTIDSSSKPAPLSRVAASFIQPPSSPQHNEWHKLRSLLYLLRFGSTTSPHQDPAVVGALNRTQKSVLTLLEEWWTGRAHDTALPKIKRYHFVLALLSDSDKESFHLHLSALKALVFEADFPFLHDAARIRELFFDRKDHSHKRYIESLERIEEDMIESMDASYHRRLAKLYAYELLPSASSTDMDIRASASSIAAYERIGFHAWMHVSSGTDGSTPDPRSFLLSKNSKLKDWPRPIPMTLNPCHWLEDNESDGLPAYLWDIKLSCTVKTAEISRDEIRYAIVSHTWGRLREGYAMESVYGVPWRVPKITCYDVKKLPQMIMDAGFSESYIWLDLFCIPQEMSIDWQLRICKDELPRQLAIFRNASIAVIWLNDVSSWDKTQGVVAWLGLRCLSGEPEGSARYKGLCDLDEALDVARRSASYPCDLLIENIIVEEEVQETIPPAWFTSLWTLQEITIRPDMILLDKHWRPLAVGNKLLLTMDSLLSLVGENSGVEDTPKGVATLISVYKDRHIGSMGRDNRLNPFLLGAHRVSTSPRAPAIMSAVGATAWFRGRTLEQFQSPEEADQLVLGIYPLDFVKEFCDLSGAAFFSCWTNIATLVMHEDTGIEPAPGYPLRGTMLPFMPIPVDLLEGFIESPPDSVHKVDHPSVRSWRVQSNGGVILPTVAIIASNSMELQISCELQCVIRSNHPENTTSRDAFVFQLPIHDWIRGFCGQAHAICTMFSLKQMAGIILHRVKISDPFIKAGAFSCGWPFNLRDEDEETGIDPRFMTVCDVDWHVL
ncbi:hypothetical protein BDW59DRAFT_163867 [Aspergillus cavernicola]|uniref:Heterokaryon incompatibility domain-containing protein n=1 Tax=Aspergillus cavernicola TaxID=176166 RepID=A0ABR4I3E3_9EURO